MSRNIIAFAAGALLLSPVAAHAVIIDGSFSGTMSDGTDISGVFGEPAATDLSGDPVTGTFVYDSSLFTGTPAGTTDTYANTATGALTVTLTINGVSHTFTDSANSSIFLDAGPNSEVQYVANASSSAGGSTIADTFDLDIFDPTDPFVTSTSLNQSFSTSDATTLAGSFSIIDTGPAQQAVGDFTINTLSQGPAPVATPEPASMALLGVGMAGIAAIRKRRVTAK
jgi:hypothetical protein